MELTKFCKGCDTEKSVYDFAKRTLPSGTVTFQTKCKPCMRAYHAANKDKHNEHMRLYRIENKEELNRKQRETYTVNKDVICERNQRWAKANPERVRENWRRAYHARGEAEHVKERAKHKRLREKIAPTRKAWAKANPHKVRTYEQNRRGRELNAEGSFTAAEWLDRLLEFNNHCAYCLQPLDKVEQEHMNPLSRGGTNNIDNLVPSCPPCNRKKHDKNLLEFAREATSAPFLAVGAVA